MACDCSALRSEILSQRQLMVDWFETLMSELKDVKCDLNAKFNSFNMGPFNDGEQYSTTAQPVISEPFSASVILGNSSEPDNVPVSANSTSTSCFGRRTPLLEQTISPEITTTDNSASEPAFGNITDFYQPKFEPTEETSIKFTPLQTFFQQSAVLEDETIPVSIDSMNADETNSYSERLTSSKELDQAKEKPRKLQARKNSKRDRSKNLIRCDKCEYETSCSWRLKRHSLLHSKEKPFSCDLCSYRCRQMTQIVVHKRRRHTGEKPFACDLCDWRFCRDSELQIHRYTHTGEKPFACNFCAFRSTRKHSLKLHQRVHTGEKPYKCDFCDYRAAFRATLAYHRRQKHGEQK